MKFGYCINMLSLPGSDGSGREFLPMIAESGFDYAELPLAQMMCYGDSDFQRLFLDPLSVSGLECHCCNNFFPAGIRLTGPDADHAGAIEYAKRAMDRAARLGARKIVFGSSGARNHPIGFDRGEATGQLEGFLAALMPIAAGLGITVVLEHLNRGESNLLNSLDEAVELRRRLGLPGLENLFDHYHLVLGGGSFDEIRKAGGHLRHVHIARVLGRSLPREGEESHIREMFGVLREIGYDGDASIEAYAPVEDRAASIRDSLVFLKSL